MISLWSKKKTR